MSRGRESGAVTGGVGVGPVGFALSSAVAKEVRHGGAQAGWSDEKEQPAARPGRRTQLAHIPVPAQRPYLGLRFGVSGEALYHPLVLTLPAPPRPHPFCGSFPSEFGGSSIFRRQWRDP